MSDYGIVISDKDSDVNKLEDILFTTKYPTAKLDTTNPSSFRDIVLRFANDPPEPDPSGGVTDTLVGSVAHGYTRVTSYWTLVHTFFAPGAVFYQPYFQEEGAISAQVVGEDVARFYIDIDDENVNFHLQKVNTGLGSANNLTGFVLKIRLYVFAEDLGI